MAASSVRVQTTKETILRSISVMSLHNYLQQGYQIPLVTPKEQIHLVVPELEPAPQSTWLYLVSRPHPKAAAIIRERAAFISFYGLAGYATE